MLEFAWFFDIPCTMHPLEKFPTLKSTHLIIPKKRPIHISPTDRLGAGAEFINSIAGDL